MTARLRGASGRSACPPCSMPLRSPRRSSPARVLTSADRYAASCDRSRVHLADEVRPRSRAPAGEGMAASVDRSRPPSPGACRRFIAAWMLAAWASVARAGASAESVSSTTRGAVALSPARPESRPDHGARYGSGTRRSAHALGEEVANLPLGSSWSPRLRSRLPLVRPAGAARVVPLRRVGSRHLVRRGGGAGPGSWRAPRACRVPSAASPWTS